MNAGTLDFIVIPASPKRILPMSVEIARALREEAEKAIGIADHQTPAADQEVLRRIAARLIRIAEKLERDAKD